MTHIDRFCLSVGVTLIVLTGACATLGSGSRDVQFVVAGIARDSHGTPLDGVIVQLRLEGPAFQGTTPVTDARRVTDSTGAFSFAFTVHRRGMPFRLVCEKPGYVEHAVSGSAPPSKQYEIALQQLPR